MRWRLTASTNYWGVNWEGVDLQPKARDYAKKTL